MGYSRIYGIKSNLSNFTLYRCREKLLVDTGYAASSKAILYIIISTRGSLSPNKVSLLAGKQPNLLFFKAWFPYDHWRLVTITGIISKVFSNFNDHMETKFSFSNDHQQSQQLPTITMITIAGIELESISAIVAIVNNHQRSQKVNGNH